MRKLFWLLAIPTLFLVGCAHSISPSNNSEKGSTMSGWKTLPVGRMLIDVPNEAMTSFREDKIWATVLSWRQDLTPEQAVKEACGKETLYKSVKASEATMSPAVGVAPPPNMFVSMVPFANGGLGVHHWSEIDVYADDKIRNFSPFTTAIDCYFMTPSPKQRVFFYMPSEIAAPNIESAENRVKGLSETFGAREEEEMPTEPGFCFYGGFSAFNGRRNEHINRHFTLPRYQGLKIVFVFETIGFEKDIDDPEEISRGLKRFKGKVLRNRRVKLEGRPRAGRELCVTFTNPNTGGKEYDFILSVPSEHPMDQPNIYLSMQSGSVAEPSSYSGPQTFGNDHDALEMWDNLVKGIRSRPGAV